MKSTNVKVFETFGVRGKSQKNQPGLQLPTFRVSTKSNCVKSCKSVKFHKTLRVFMFLGRNLSISSLLLLQINKKQQ